MKEPRDDKQLKDEPFVETRYALNCPYLPYDIHTSFVLVTCVVRLKSRPQDLIGIRDGPSKYLADRAEAQEIPITQLDVLLWFALLTGTLLALEGGAKASTNRSTRVLGATGVLVVGTVVVASSAG